MLSGISAGAVTQWLRRCWNQLSTSLFIELGFVEQSIRRVVGALMSALFGAWGLFMFAFWCLFRFDQGFCVCVFCVLFQLNSSMLILVLLSGQFAVMTFRYARSAQKTFCVNTAERRCMRVFESRPVVQI